MTLHSIAPNRSSRAVLFKPLVQLRMQPDRERQRRWIVKIIFIVYWLLIFEGALRKWALPGMHSILFFIRDPFVLSAYAIAYKYNMWPRISPGMLAGLVLACLFAFLALIQAIAGEGSPVILAYGWRNYFFYLPFAFLIGAHFKGPDLRRLFRYNLMAVIPIAVLCHQQFSASGDDLLNASYSPSAKAMLVSQGIVRTTGTFTVSAAQTLFVGSMFAMLVAAWLLPRKQRPLNGILLWLASGAVLTTLAVSGARSVFIYVFTIAVAGVASNLLLKSRKLALKRLIIVPAIATIFAVGYVTIFPKAFQAMAERQMNAQINEGSTALRALGSFTAVANVWPKISLIGAGIGVGTNAGAVLATGKMTFLLSEDEWSRIVLETGVLGFLYIGYRLWLIFWLLSSSIKATRRSYNPTPLLLIAFALINLAVGQMTLQGTINGYGWLFAGFCMAANNLKLKKIVASGELDLWA